jgi:hypothetical protein
LQQNVETPSQPNPSLPPSSPSATSTRPTSPVVTERLSEPPVSAGGKRPIVLSDDETDEGTKTCKRRRAPIILSDDEGYKQSESPKQTKDNPVNGEYGAS